jgi:hypothetical protein
MISRSEAFLFFAAILLGSIIGVAGNLIAETLFHYSRWCKDHPGFILMLSTIVFIVLFATSFFYFLTLVGTQEIPEEDLCECNNCTNNYYLYNISNFTLVNQKSTITIPFFKDLFRSEEYSVQTSLGMNNISNEVLLYRV